MNDSLEEINKQISVLYKNIIKMQLEMCNPLFILHKQNCVCKDCKLKKHKEEFKQSFLKEIKDE